MNNCQRNLKTKFVKAFKPNNWGLFGIIQNFEKYKSKSKFAKLWAVLTV